jgi:hypothetical protein
LPPLPSDLIILWCQENQIEALPDLPPKLDQLHCHMNLLTHLPDLPATLNELDCKRNRIHSLPTLPYVLTKLNCTENELETLPKILPINMKILRCTSNKLRYIPPLPKSLETFECADNAWNSQFQDSIAFTGRRIMNAPKAIEEFTLEEYFRLVKHYKYEQKKIQKQARKIIQISHILNTHEHLNSDIVSVVCSFLTGVKGSLSSQLYALKDNYDSYA